MLGKKFFAGCTTRSVFPEATSRTGPLPVLRSVKSLFPFHPLTSLRLSVCLPSRCDLMTKEPTRRSDGIKARRQGGRKVVKPPPSPPTRTLALVTARDDSYIFSLFPPQCSCRNPFQVFVGSPPCAANRQRGGRGWWRRRAENEERVVTVTRLTATRENLREREFFLFSSRLSHSFSQPSC